MQRKDIVDLMTELLDEGLLVTCFSGDLRDRQKAILFLRIIEIRSIRCLIVVINQSGLEVKARVSF